MRPLKVAAVVVTVIAGAIASVLLAEALFSRPDTGPFDHYAIKRLKKLCGHRDNCQVRLADLTDRPWDAFYEWTNPYSTADIEKVIGQPLPVNDEDGRMIVLTNHGRVVFQGHGEEGVEQSLANEVFITCRTHTESFTTCKPDALMQVTVFDAAGDPARGLQWSGKSYNLTQIN
jgi:hypothetical protein